MGGLHGVFILGTLLVLTLANVETEQDRRVLCPSGWTFTHNGCYSVIREKQNWMDAQLSCLAMNAHLVTITSYAENQAVLSLLNEEGGDRAWIGLNDMLAEGRFRWVNGDSDATYTRWTSGEPSGYFNDKAENCGELVNHGYWNDLPCDFVSSFFVCEKE